MSVGHACVIFRFTGNMHCQITTKLCNPVKVHSRTWDTNINFLWGYWDTKRVKWLVEFSFSQIEENASAFTTYGGNPSDLSILVIKEDLNVIGLPKKLINKRSFSLGS